MKQYLIPILLLLMVFLPILNGCGQSSAEKEEQEEKIVEQETETIAEESTEKAISIQPEDESQQEETVEPEQKATVTKEESNDPSTEKKEETAAVQEPIQQPAFTKQPDAVSSTKDQSSPLKSAEKKVESTEPKTNNVQTPVQAKPKTTEAAEPETETVSVSITGNDHRTILSTTNVELQDGDSVLDVLKRITTQKQISFEYSGIGAAAYIEGIGNLYEFDHGPLSGWMFKVNGEFSQKGAGTVKIKNGDVIEWVYTTDLGKDVGAKTS